MALPRKYARAVWESERVLATWLPDRQLKLGDIISRGRRDAAFHVETHLDDIVGLGRRPRSTTHAGIRRLVLQDGVAFEARADATSPGAGLRARLAGESSFLFLAEQGQVEEYQRRADVRQLLSALAQEGTWSREWLLVTAVRSFSAVTLLIAESADVEAAIDGDPGPAAGLDLVHAGAGVSVGRGRAATWSLGHCTPLFEALVIRRRLFRDDEVEDAFLSHEAAPGPEPSDEVAQATPAELGLVDE